MTPSTAPALYGDPFAPGLLRRLPGPPRKVALLRASRIGDFLCAVPAFRALRAALHEAEIAMITLPLLRELALRSPYLDRVIPFPGFPGIAEQFFDARGCLGFLQEMQAERFDLAIQMQGSGVHSNPFTLLLGARATASSSPGGWTAPSVARIARATPAATRNPSSLASPSKIWPPQRWSCWRCAAPRASGIAVMITRRWRRCEVEAG